MCPAVLANDVGNGPGGRVQTPRRRGHSLLGRPVLVVQQAGRNLVLFRGLLGACGGKGLHLGERLAGDLHLRDIGVTAQL